MSLGTYVFSVDWGGKDRRTPGTKRVAILASSSVRDSTLKKPERDQRYPLLTSAYAYLKSHTFICMHCIYNSKYSK